MGASGDSGSDLAVARAVADEVRATDTGMTWRKVTTLLDRFGAGRLTPDVRARIGEALAAAEVQVKPPIDDVQRFETVRLSLGLEGGPDEGRTRTMTHVVPVAEAVRVGEWRPGEPARERALFEAAPVEGPLWVDLDVGHTEPEVAFEALRPLCPGLTREMLAELFTVDPRPKVSERGDGELRFVSCFSVHAEESERGGDDADASKAGALVFQLVEILCGEGWLISCWHRSKRYEGAEEIAEGPPRGHDDVYRAVERHWSRERLETAGDLATLVVYELVGSYPQASRVLTSWLEQWELDFHRRFDETERDTLIAIRALLAEFEERLVAFERPEVDPGEAWFTGLTGDRWATRVDHVVGRVLSDLTALSAALRSSLDLFGVYSAAQHLSLARHQAAQSERFQETVAVVTSMLLVPTLIASLFGSNTMIPGQDEWWGFFLMLGLIGLGATTAYLLIRPRRRG
jgi:Mg2+ and Co2+ transporter CorA